MNEYDAFNILEDVWMGDCVNKEVAARWLHNHNASIVDVGRDEVTILVNEDDADGFFGGIVFYQTWNPDDIEILRTGTYLQVWVWWD